MTMENVRKPSEIDQITSWFNDDPLDRTNTINPQIVWSKARSKYYSSKAARVLSVPQIIFGIVSIITQSCALGARMGYFSSFGSGIWCGAVFILTGSIGLVAAKRQTLSWEVTYAVSCAFMFLAGLGSAVMSIVSATLISAPMCCFAPEQTDDDICYTKLAEDKQPIITRPALVIEDDKKVYHKLSAEQTNQLIGVPSLMDAEEKKDILLTIDDSQAP